MPNEENNNPAESASIRVYIANLGKYNEGELVGGWLDLPQPQVKIDEFLQDTVGLTLNSEEAYQKGLHGERVYEEYAIHDYEFPQNMNGFTPNNGEYVPLRTLNALACLLELVDDDSLAVIEMYQDQIENLDPIEQASMLAHFASGEYPDGVWFFDTEGFKNDEEAFGYCCVHELNPELSKVLNDQSISDYFDYERYGEGQSQDGYLCDGIFIDGRSNLHEWADDLDISEIQEVLAEEYGEDYFQSFGDKKLWSEREALGKERGFELERDEDRYYYYRTFRPEEGKDINTDAPERFRAAETLDRSSLYGFERNGEGSFVKQFEVFDAVSPQIKASYETEVSWDDEQKQWEVCTTNLDTGKTLDVLWEAEIKDALKEADDQVREIVDGSFFRYRTLQQQSEERISDREHGNEAHEEAKAPKRASSLDELAARGREKAEEHNKNLKNNNQDLKKKQMI